MVNERERQPNRAGASPIRIGAFTTKNGHGVCLFVREDGKDTSHTLTIDEAQAAVAELVKTLAHARRRRVRGDWTDEPPCRHGTDLHGRIEHALFYAMHDEFEDECIDEYAAMYADLILTSLGMGAVAESTQAATPDADEPDTLVPNSDAESTQGDET